MLPPHCRGMSSPRTTTILVAPCSYRPRRELTIAHELIELSIPDDVRKDDCLCERICQRGAAALLLPQREFISSMFDCGWELPAARRRWKHASWEAIGSRLSDLLPGFSSAAWSDLQPKWRRPEPAATGAELAAVREAYKRGRGKCLSAGNLALAWHLVSRRGFRYAVSICLPVS